MLLTKRWLGRNGSVIGKKLSEAVEKGSITQDEADRIAYGLTNYLDAEAGNYKRPTTETGKKLQEVQRNIIFLYNHCRFTTSYYIFYCRDGTDYDSLNP